MIGVGKSVSAVLGLVVALGVTTEAMAQDAIARVAGLQTNVQRNGSDVRVRDSIFIGDNLRTNATGISQFQFADRSSAKLGPNSVIRFTNEIADLANRDTSVAMRMIQGVARIVGSDASKSRPVVVATPNMTLGVLGGIVEVTFENGGTRAALTSGKMVCRAGGAERSVRRTGFSCVVGPDNTLRLEKTPRDFASVLDAPIVPNASAASTGPALIQLADELGLQCGAAQNATSTYCNTTSGGYPIPDGTDIPSFGAGTVGTPPDGSGLPPGSDGSSPGSGTY